MDSSNLRTQASDAANPDGSGETFVGTIRWLALAIGVACLALLTLVGSLAHAATPLRSGFAAATTGSHGDAHGAADRPLLDAARGRSAVNRATIEQR